MNLRCVFLFLTLLMCFCYNLSAQAPITKPATDTSKLQENGYLDDNHVEEINIFSIENYLISQRKIQSPDQLFVHLDRNMYSPGDTICFQAYVRDRFTNEFVSKSISLYALLYDEKYNKVDSSRFRINNSLAKGWMAVPTNAAFGNYHFIAFTSIMQNYDPSFSFQADLSVREKDTDSGNSETPSDEQGFDLKFLPEGGNLITGIEQRIGFNATDNKGFPRQFTGLLKNSSGFVIDTIESGIYGPGLFTCKPEKGMYVEIIKGTIGEKTWPLPNPDASGACLSVKPIDNRSFAVEIQSNLYDNDTLIVSGIMNSTQIFSHKIILGRKQKVVVETDQLLSGVVQITLFNDELRPLAERLYYVNPDKHLVYTIKTAKAEYGQGEETELTVSITDGEGNPVEGFFSISVADSLSGHNGQLFSPGIEYCLNYKSAFVADLPPSVLEKGLENLTNEERDLLLMVYGWRRYNWDFDKSSTNTPDPVNYDLLNVRLLNNLKNNPKARTLDLISLEGPSVEHLLLKNNSGISFPLDSLPDITRTVTLVPDPKDKNRITEAALSIPFNSDYFKPKKLIILQPKIHKENYSTSQADYIKLPDDDFIEIPEVTIKGYPRVKKIYQNIYEERYEYAEIKSSTPELLKRSVYLETAIRIIANPILITDDAIILRGGKSFFGGPVSALIVLDGMPLYSQGWRFTKDIPVTEIASITVLKGSQGRTIYGQAANGGVIFINTMFHDPSLSRVSTEWKSQNTDNDLLLPVNIYRSDIEFYNPSKSDMNYDPVIQKRSTYYWDPEVYFKADEPIKIRYLNLKHSGPVLISINGVSLTNLVGTGKASYSVK